MAAESWKHLYEVNNFCHPVTLAWFSMQIHVNSKIFQLSLNLSLSIMELKSPLKAIWALKCVKERFNEFTRICMENHASVTAKVVYLIHMLPTFGGRCNRCFWDIRLKILKFPNFNMLFQLVLTKFFKSELFSCLPKVGYVIKSCKEPIDWAIT